MRCSHSVTANPPPSIRCGREPERVVTFVRPSKTPVGPAFAANVELRATSALPVSLRAGVTEAPVRAPARQEDVMAWNKWLLLCALLCASPVAIRANTPPFEGG